MKTRPIGERFKYVDVTLEVRKGNRCAGCYYLIALNVCTRNLIAGECGAVRRADGESVVFARVEE